MKAGLRSIKQLAEIHELFLFKLFVQFSADGCECPRIELSSAEANWQPMRIKVIYNCL